jgi:hypothetical protein
VRNLLKAATTLVMILPWASASGQSKAKAVEPDLSGVWSGPYTPNLTRGGIEIPFTPWGEAKFKSYDPLDDPTAQCLPPGLVRAMNAPFPIQIVQSPGQVLLLWEYMHFFRMIPTDGRDHPKDLDPTWMGNPVGKWDGDTLVVDTIGFNGQDLLLDTIGHPHTENLHVIERFHRTGALSMSYELTVEDPKVFSRPWTTKRVFTLKPDDYLMEYICNENNHVVGKGLKPTQ